MARTMLILVRYTDDDGNDLDLFVEATNGAEAVRLWRDHYELSEYDHHRPDRLIALPERTGTPRAIPWENLATA